MSWSMKNLIYTKLWIFSLLLTYMTELQASNINDAPELYWQRISGNILPANAFPLLTDNDVQYYSCRPVYSGTVPALTRLFKNLRGTVGVENNGALTCDYLIYAYRSLRYKQSITDYLPGNSSGLLDHFTRIYPDQPLFSSRTAPGTPFDLLSETTDDNTQSARISFTAESFNEAITLVSQTFYLSDMAGNSDPFLFNGGSASCQQGTVRIDFADDTFCIPNAEYCRKYRPPYFIDSDDFLSDSDSNTSALHTHDVIGLTFPSDTESDTSFVSKRCFWHQEPRDLFKELTVGLPDFHKLLFTLPSRTQPPGVAGPATFPHDNTTRPATPDDKGRSYYQDLKTYTAVVTIMSSTSLLGLAIGIPVTIIFMYFWHHHRVKSLMKSVGRPIE